MTTATETPDIVVEAITRVLAMSKPIAVIARESDVPESWMRMLVKGKIPNPGIRQFSKLIEYLDRNEQAPPPPGRAPSQSNAMDALA